MYMPFPAPGARGPHTLSNAVHMNASLLQQKLPLVSAWIDRTLAAHTAQARAVASFGFPRLGSYYSADLLASARAVVVDRLPIPPLASMGLTGFDEFESLDAAGITYRSTYFVRDDHQRSESLHFHELVHVIQWCHLGPDHFMIAYALGHLLGGGYRTNPLEDQAYTLQARFDQRDTAFDVESLVRPELDAIVLNLMRSAQQSRMLP